MGNTAGQSNWFDLPESDVSVIPLVPGPQLFLDHGRELSSRHASRLDSMRAPDIYNITI